METLLLTGFEPFGGEAVNPSWEAVRMFDGAQIGGCYVHTRCLPTAFGLAGAKLQDALRELRPRAVLCIGQAGGRPDISVERVAINVDDARIADNAGYAPVDEPVVPGGPAAYFSRLPIKAIAAGLREAGIPASVSQTAGTFVCNHVMYRLLHEMALDPKGGIERGGFLHIPFLPAQAAQHPGAPSMALADIARGIELAASITLASDRDLALAEGATH